LCLSTAQSRGVCCQYRQNKPTTLWHNAHKFNRNNKTIDNGCVFILA